MNHVPDVTSELCYARIFFFLGLKYFELLIIWISEGRSSARGKLWLGSVYDFTIVSCGDPC